MRSNKILFKNLFEEYSRNKYFLLPFQTYDFQIDCIYLINRYTVRAMKKIMIKEVIIWLTRPNIFFNCQKSITYYNKYATAKYTPYYFDGIHNHTKYVQ